MRKPQMIALLIATTLSSVAFAAEVTGGVTTSPGKGKAVSVVTATGMVQSVDPATRTVVLKMPNGETHSVVAGAEVQNFDRIKVGDKVKAKYVEALTVELKKDGKEVVGRSETGSMERAAKGDTPGAMATRQVSVTADVVGVDHKKNIVHLKNEHGEIVDLQLNDPEQTKLVKKGDQVQATYTEAVAMALEPAAPAKKK